MEEIKVGDIVDATITGIQPYGAFASLEDHTSGLIHISEISDRFVKDVNYFVKVGETIKVKVIDKDDEHHQTKLSIKAVKTSSRKYRRHYNLKRELIHETPLGFSSLKERLDDWIHTGIVEEEHNL